MDAKIKKMIVTGFIGTAGLKAIGIALSFALSVFLARFLGPDGFGTYTLVISIVSVLSIPAAAGMATLLVREISSYAVSDQYEKIKGVIKWANLVSILISFLIIIILLVIASLIEFEDISFKSSLFWGAALILIMALGSLRSAALRGFRRVVLGQLPELVIKPAALLLFIIIINNYTEVSPVVAIKANLASSFLALCLGAIFLFWCLPVKVREASYAYEKSIWIQSVVPLAFISSIVMLNKHVSVLVMGVWLENSQVGLFRVADQLAHFLPFPLMVANMVIAPHVSRLFAANKRNDLQRLVTVTSRVIAIFSLPVIVVFVIYGREVIGMTYGSEYEGAYWSLVWLCAGQLINILTGPAIGILNMSRNEKSALQALAFGLFLGLILNLILVPIYGISGGAAAVALSMSAVNVLMYYLAKSKTGINALAFFGK